MTRTAAKLSSSVLSGPGRSPATAAAKLPISDAPAGAGNSGVLSAISRSGDAKFLPTI